ncbi:MAG: 50S ribosomal protein L11 methyltransferase [Bacteroidota bacterium]|nr:50S ribosomal protein L11 methyltransferase [Candidatus Kapabacteria bacterium]MDW8219810.1 50S ribosomal protein L11 methyltransferase [Bacteroidota bacterium]
MNKLYLLLRYAIPEERFEDAYTALSDTPHIGIIESYDELSIYFLHACTEDFQAAMITHVHNQFMRFNIPAVLQESAIIQEENWHQQWEDSIDPVWVNERIVITPSWKYNTVSHADIPLIIDPQMSFGTGHHETTRMMVQLLELSVQHGDFWIDVGTGTGVLAILAWKLGAARLYALDNDTWSIHNAVENFARNGIPLEHNTAIHIEQNNINTTELPSCHGIAANLHCNLIMHNIAKFYNALREYSGTLVVSGLLRYDAQTVLDVAKQCGFILQKCIDDGEWIAMQWSAR